MAAGGYMAGVMIGRNLDLLKKGIEEARVAWKPLAEGALTLVEDPLSSAFTKAVGPSRPRLHGPSVDVHIEWDAVYFARTEVTAKATATDVVVGVHLNPGGVLGYLREWIGQDIQIGDEQFDPAYLVTGKPESAAVSLLVPSVRELVLTLGSNLAGFTHEHENVKVVLRGVETDTAVLRAAIDLATAAGSWTPG
ncbi:MAG: hypothetical protein JST00_30350 [Deltaproteobacteria bacterium]|nr:hypothetical protein [Deltaproteobacteria bacterium]